MNAIHLSNRAGLWTAIACICILLPVTAVRAQTGPAEGPLPPPAAAPESRLIVTPAEFEYWLAGLTPADDTAIAREQEDAPPSLVTPPPPPPTLVARPPPTIAPAPAPAATVQPGAPTRPLQPALTPPPAPVLESPAAPRVATLPPNSRATIPPPFGALARPDAVKILYPRGVMELPEAAEADLAQLAAWLRQNPGVRVQIVGYASDSGEAGNQARRTSLYRTLAVRKYLVDNGVLSTRMDVRALGAGTDEMPRDRVEISLRPS